MRSVVVLIAVGASRVASVLPDRISRIFSRAAYEVIKRIRPSDKPVPVVRTFRFNGRSVKMILDIGQKTQLKQFIQKLYQPEMTPLFKQLLKPGQGAFIDIGSHVGYYALLASQLLDGSNAVLGFEPDNENRAALVINLSLNGVANSVSVFDVALSDVAGQAVLHRNPLNEGGHTLKSADAYGDDGKKISKDELKTKLPTYQFNTDVKTATLDEILASENVGKIQLIKIDVEGHELPCLRGMSALLSSDRRPNAVICEVSASTIDPVCEFMRPFGYSADVLTHDGPVPLVGSVLPRKSHDLLFRLKSLATGENILNSTSFEAEITVQ